MVRFLEIELAAFETNVHQIPYQVPYGILVALSWRRALVEGSDILNTMMHCQTMRLTTSILTERLQRMWRITCWLLTTDSLSGRSLESPANSGMC